MDKFQILLKNLKIEDKGYDVELKNVSIKKDKTYVFDLYHEDVIDYGLYELLMNNKDNFPYPCKFNFEYNNKNLNGEKLNNYLKSILENLKNIYPFCSNITLDDIEYGEKVKIKVINEIQHQKCVEIKDEFIKEFKKTGLYYDVEFIVKENDENYNDLSVQMETFEPVVMDVEYTPTKKVEKKNNYSFNNKYKREYKKVLMKDIDSVAVGDRSFVEVSGFIFNPAEIKVTKNNKLIQTIPLTDYTDSIYVKRFGDNKEELMNDMKSIEKGNCWIKVRGEVSFDRFSNELTLRANKIEIIQNPHKKERVDNAEQKRVELHVHSKMSTIDGVNTISEYIDLAASLGHSAIAITDKDNVQAFPEAQAAAEKHGLKMIYGAELNMVESNEEIVFNEKDLSLENSSFVSFDLETTGLSLVHDKITEFGAVKIKNGEVIDRLQSFINPEMEIPAKIVNLTSITNEDVQGAPKISEFIDRIIEFFGDSILVAHNANFDIGFLNESLERLNKPKIQNPVIDSLALARTIIPKTMQSYRLGAVCRYYHIEYDGEVAHRADYDAEVLGNALVVMIHEIMGLNHYNLLDINQLPQDDGYKLVKPSHVTALVLNKTGLRNLFKIITEENTKYLHKVPRIPKDRLEHYHEGIIYGTSCYNSDVFEACLNGNDETLDRLIKFYDYVEIQPFDDYYHLIDRGIVRGNEQLEISLKRLVEAAKRNKKLIVATGDVHFLNQRDKIYRDILITNLNIGIGGKSHPLSNRANPNTVNPDQYFRTTDEMLECYPYLSEEDTYEYVVTNTNKIADMVEVFKPIHSKLYPPSLENADQNLVKMCYETAHKVYGEELPQIVESRLKYELDNILKHGFGVIYYIAALLVKKSNDDGYVVGSRGSVGSSFAATMAGITEVNPLIPHYICPHCSHSEFLEEGTISDGYDLPDKECPVCHSKMKGEGHNIPFQTFLGFNADKVPDIDLNFSGEYQSKAHAFTKEIFGEDKVFKAGTISTIADTTAYGYVLGYLERKGRSGQLRDCEIKRLAKGVTDVKRTTGQHPGGIIVIPNEMDVFDFTPYQYPADDVNSEWLTTHFDFHSIHDNVLKFDILGHVDPTVTKELQDLTGVNPKDIPTNDPKVMSLFTSGKELGIDLSCINQKTGALGLPEFGTKFVLNILKDTHPKDFHDLVIISGLSHGTDVYKNNAESLIAGRTCTLSEVIGCRDDIMVYLIEKGMENKDAFDIMEVVRKGRSLEVFPKKNYDDLMKEHDVPQWYIDSCKKIKYMFPKAHAVAYVLSAIRIAWWKVYYPREYYAVYFSTRCDVYDIMKMVKGKEAILEEIQNIEKRQSLHEVSNKDIALKEIFYIVIEMYERGYHFNCISLKYSAANKFILDPEDDKGILPPFSSVDSLGEAVANTVIEARKEREFITKEDVIKRTKLSSKQIDYLSKMGVFKDMQEENQMSLF